MLKANLGNFNRVGEILIQALTVSEIWKIAKIGIYIFTFKLNQRGNKRIFLPFILLEF